MSAPSVPSNGQTYYLFNGQATTLVMDLSMSDGATVSGWAWNNGENQRWTAWSTGSGWMFESKLAPGKYLVPTSSPNNGVKLTVSSSPAVWAVIPSPLGRSDLNPHTITTGGSGTYAVDLVGGSSTNGTSIVLSRDNKSLEQVWYIV